MQTSNLKFIAQFNALREAAEKNSPDFPDSLCEFICGEFQYQAVLLFKVNAGNKLGLAGRSSGAKKALNAQSVYQCPNCKSLAAGARQFEPFQDTGCQIHAGLIPQNDVCMPVTTTAGAKYLFKFALKTPFTSAERDYLKITGTFLQSLLDAWPAGGIGKAGINQVLVEGANELRTPINSIVGFASLLNDDQLTPSQKENVLTLRETAQRTLTLINDMIEYAKSDTGLLTANQATVQIQTIFDELTAAYFDKHQTQPVHLQKTIEKNVPASFRVDLAKFKFVLHQYLTLIVNCAQGGQLFINVSVGDGNTLAVRMFTSGAVASIPQLSQIIEGQTGLDPKYQRVAPISHLAIPLAKKYLDVIQGSFEYSVSPVKGISLNFRFPLEALSALESKISTLPKPEGKSKVLVIEDDYATSKLLSNYLNKWGYSPVIINSGLKALDMLKKDKYLAVIMDIVLPDVNGLELLKRIHEDEHSKYIPVIVCSVEAEQQKAFLMGAVEYFVKPIRYKDLVEVLTSYKLKKDSNVLCVDDDVPTLNLVKGAIESVGFNPIAFSDSTKVLDSIKDTVLDLAIIDLDMPEINGFQLIKLIKSQQKYTNLPIIIYTGKENFDEDLKNIDGLFTDLLSKRSTRIEDLADTINAMINRYEQPSPPEEVKTITDEPKILLEEDYKHSQIIVTRLLKKNGFTMVVVVENGQEAVDQVKQQKFDLILMDMQMPVMNGFEATERIRKIPEYKNIPIIALTAFAMKGDKEKCLEAGATDYIPKPIDSVEFIEKVRHYTAAK